MNIKGNGNSFTEPENALKEIAAKNVVVNLIKERFHECLSCSKVFSNANDFKQHLKVQHKKPKKDDNSGIKCNKCNTILAAECSLMIHQQVNCRSDILKCIKCEMVCMGKENYTEHMKLHRTWANFTVDEEIKGRLRKRNSNKQVESTTKQVTIYEGPQEILDIQQNKIELRLAKRKGRKPKIETVIAPRPELDSLIGFTMLQDAKLLTNSDRQKFLNRTMKPEKCSLCDNAFNDVESLKKHMVRHSKNRPFKCKSCNYTFNNRQALDYHKMIHTNKRPFQCRVCGKCFRRNCDLTRHKSVHSDAHPFKCGQCESKFKLLPYLYEHMKVHSGEKPYKCNLCEKSFSQSDSLTKHRKIHSSIKAYKCEFCEKAFRQPGVLYGHRKIHTGEKPHKCRVCNKAFISKSHTTRHEKIHK